VDLHEQLKGLAERMRAAISRRNLSQLEVRQYIREQESAGGTEGQF
jgi:hypothetical protein